uniref:Cysteine-rich DPF motif domain-containing protein 1 n=1 Tax=Tetraselmis sp. GSL018 TaxID=582737 RepID=A0A061RIH7_9CHLO|mmetsp:Transcript_11007/g.26112  ORF Transcript_11007/g.26112 Transcript_11007/m.26112 type:complete len:106 (-) Transcript_11007:595-912(-)
MSTELSRLCCAVCNTEIAYLEKGHRSSLAPYISFIDEALTRPDPFAANPKSLPLQVGAICSVCQSAVCMHRSCSVFYKSRYCTHCAQLEQCHLPTEVVPTASNTC